MCISYNITGDQDNRADIQRWVEESGGNFDVIVDDGGHRNSHILNTFMGLWRALKPGGLYFIEDLQVGRERQYRGTSEFVVGEVMLYDIYIYTHTHTYTLHPTPYTPPTHTHKRTHTGNPRMDRCTPVPLPAGQDPLTTR